MSAKGTIIMKAKLFSGAGQAKGEIDLPDSVFSGEIKEHLLYQTIKAFQANQRQGTAKTKGRAEVSGGGRKPWKQKGTGRARSGSNTSSVWVRGGKAFGPDPRDYTTRIPRKMRKAALKSALSARAQEEKVYVLDGLSVEKPSTRVIAGLLTQLALAGKRNLLVVDNHNQNVYLSARNIPMLDVRPIAEITALDVLSSENVIFGSESLITKVEEVVVK